MFELKMLVAYLLSTIYFVIVGVSFGNDKKLFIKPRAFLGYAFYIIIGYILTTDNFTAIKLPGMFLLLALVYLFITKKGIVESLKFSLAVIFFNFIAEMLFAVFVIFVIKMDFTLFSYENNLYILSNFIIYGTAIFLSQIKKVIKIFKEGTKSEKTIGIMIIGIAISLTMGSVAYRYQLINKTTDIIINTLLVVASIVATYYIIKMRNDNGKLSDQYDVLFKYIERYEKELSKSKKLLHEHKNQLITMRGLVLPQNKELTGYIESIIGDVKNQEIQGIKGLENIPSTMIKGLLYYKLNDMEENGIHFELITTKAKTKKANKLIEQMKKNIEKQKNVMKVIGVTLDNAIEAAAKSKEKEIIFEMQLEDELCSVIISNTFDGQVNKNKIGQIGYSTKGKNRGYGLSLIKDITTKDKNITFQHSIVNDMFVAEIKIKI